MDMSTAKDHPHPQIRQSKPTESTQIERELLGSLLHGAEYFDRVSQIIDAEDFGYKDHGKLFLAFQMLHAAGKPLHNIKLLSKEIERFNGCKSICSHVYLNEIFCEVSNAAHVLYFAEQLRVASRKRKLVEISNELLRRSLNPLTSEEEDAAYIAGQAQGFQSTIDHAAQSIEEAATELISHARDIVEHRKAHKTGITTGLNRIDSMLGPVVPGEMAIVAARPGNGKTAFAMQWALNIAKEGGRVFFASLEMKNRELIGRILAPRAGLRGQQLRDMNLMPHDIDSLVQAAATFHGTKIRLWDKPNAQIGKLLGVARHEAATHGVDAMLVDYIGKLRPDKGKSFANRHEEIAYYAVEIKSIARELDIPVVCLAQLNREADKQTPSLSNLRESGKIEEEADQVIFIHNPQPEQTHDGTAVDFLIPKNRHGQRGKVSVFWNASTTSFSEVKAWDGNY